MAFDRVAWTVAASVALATLAPAAGHAQAKYPDRPVKVVIGFTAGGGTDVAGRVIAQKLSEATGQSFVVENRPGASGLIASEQVAKSPADGSTIMVGSQTTLAVAPALYKKFQLDVTKELTGLAMIGVSPLVAVVNASSPIHSLKDLIAEAKAKNGAMNFGSGGVGTTPHMAGELFAFNAGIKMVHVAYRGEAPGINDLLGGQIPFMFSNLSVVKGNIEGGKLRALAVTSSRRGAVAAGRADRRGNISGLRCRHLVRAGRTGRHAARRRDEDQRRDEKDRRHARISESASTRSACSPTRIARRTRSTPTSRPRSPNGPR